MGIFRAVVCVFVSVVLEMEPKACGMAGELLALSRAQPPCMHLKFGSLYGS